MGAVPFVIGHLVASPVSTHQMPVALPPASCDNQKCCQTLPNVPWVGGRGKVTAADSCCFSYVKGPKLSSCPQTIDEDPQTFKDHSLDTYWLRFYGPGIVLRTGNTAVDGDRSCPELMELGFQGGRNRMSNSLPEGQTSREGDVLIYCKCPHRAEEETEAGLEWRMCLSGHKASQGD